jgi:carbonic anhydrase
VHELGIAKGIEDLIDIRVAGDIPKDKMIGSVKYAAKYSSSKLIGETVHKNCGVVKASMSHENSLSSICSINEKIKFPVYLSQSIAGSPLGNASMIIASRVAEELNKKSTLSSYCKRIQKPCSDYPTIKSAAAEGSNIYKFILRISK